MLLLFIHTFSLLPGQRAEGLGVHLRALSYQKQVYLLPVWLAHAKVLGASSDGY